MKVGVLYVLIDSNGVVWRYLRRRTPVTWSRRKSAQDTADGLDKKRGWKVYRADLTVGDGSGS